MCVRLPAESLELIATAAEHSNAAIRKMVRDAHTHSRDGGPHTHTHTHLFTFPAFAWVVFWVHTSILLPETFITAYPPPPHGVPGLNFGLLFR